jgi:hypothetical protein
MAEPEQFASNKVRRHTSLDPNQAWRHVRKPGRNPAASNLLSQDDRSSPIQADQMQRVLACIDADRAHHYCVSLQGHGGMLLVLRSPQQSR